MTITEKYIEIINPSLSPCQKKQFRDGMGWTLACPFCRDAQKRESKSKEKCASLYPREGTFTYFFSCNRGLNGGVQGVHSCNYTMKFSTFLKQHHPSVYKSFVREKELAKKKLSTQVPWLGVEAVHKIFRPASELHCPPTNLTSSAPSQ